MVQAYLIFTLITYFVSRILRSLDDEIFMASRYFATVLLATEMP